VSGQNVIRLDPRQRARRAPIAGGTLAMLVFVAFEAMMFAGLVGAFMLTRATSDGIWPPSGQPWFPLGETIINTAALLVSGALVFRAGRVWERGAARIGPLLLAAIALGLFFLFFQGVVWVTLIREGLTLTSSQHGIFFCLIMGMHGANTVGALIYLGVAWLRLKPLSDVEEGRGELSSGTFSAACVLWYFAVGAWPVLCLFLYL
jgi:heme/copper-type cytochrome/quinol oxidase subunit 3